ncbi:MAG: glycoside hydrolase family 32 protein [Eubacteriales bacterium]|nr:glycoside hydrolase family 32 protein [Eubacteriales bacterium]
MKRFIAEIKVATDNIMRVARETADHDPVRPEYHFHAPAQWMDDPNGIIFHKGYYHMMYSLNPDSATARAGMVYKTGSNRWDPGDPDWTGGITVWGHARSRDLVHWEHLPVALFPDRSRDEYYIWFGCTAINDENVPVAIYTSIGYIRNPTDSAEQWICFGDDDLTTWETAGEENPILTEKAHAGKKIWEWRDPFLLRHEGKAYLVLGGKQDELDGGKAVVLLYQASNASFTRWDYRGILFEYPDPALRSVECPNLVRIGEKWALLLSRHGTAEYFIGDMDFDACKFAWQTQGKIDQSTNFYATNVLLDDRGRRLMWGAVEGFTGTDGWNGINSLPREIGLDSELCLTQRVPDEIRSIRGAKSRLGGTAGQTVARATLNMELTVPTGEHAELTLSYDGVTRYAFAFDGNTVTVGQYTVTVDPQLQDQFFEFFVDKSVVEVFINDQDVVTLTIPACTGETEVKLTSQAAVCTLWEMRSEGLFTANC